VLTDYSTIDAGRVGTVVDEAIAEGERLLAATVAVDGTRTYDNTLGPLDEALVVLHDAYGVGGYMARVHPDESVRSAASDAEERYRKWLAGLPFRTDLYAAVEAYGETADAAHLTGERRRNLDFWLRDFRRAGQELSSVEREQLEALRNRLIELQVAYDQNLDEWDDGIEVTREELDGLPDSYVSRLDPGPGEGTLRVSVTYPDYVPFMDQATNRDLRRRLQHKFMNRAAEANIPLLNEAVAVRWQMARLLGYGSFADYAMEPKMADAATVAEFYASIVPGLTDLGRKELAGLQGLMDADLGSGRLEPWDWQYYDTLQRKREFGVDDNEIAEYFPLDAVIDGMHEICGEMFGISFVEVEDPKAWHGDVRAYEIRDRSRDELIAHYYADLHPRPGKFGHAACWRLRAGVEGAEGYRRPVAAVAANFTKPTAGSPSLLLHTEAVTLFHEFGHVLHNTLTEVALPRFSGTQTERDFVEAPSQIMENWMWEPEVLRRFARHHETGVPIPDDLVERMVAARDQNVALRTLRQVFYGHYDLALHGGEGPADADEAYDDLVYLTLFPPHPDTHFGAWFGHMMDDGYVAGYYGYLWSNVYGDDMFSRFEEDGVLNPDVGMRYRRTVLARGGTVDGSELLHDFLGREPSSDAFLRKIGLSRG
jgi:thimet oligopeptidase